MDAQCAVEFGDADDDFGIGREESAARMLGGFELSGVAAEALIDLEGHGPATVWGWDQGTTPSTAALINGNVVESRSGSCRSGVRLSPTP